MKIAVVHSFYRSGQPSGENIVVGEQIRALGEAGHDVQLISKQSDEEVRKRLAPLRMARTVATGLGASPSDDLGRFKADAVLVNNLFPNYGTAWLEGWGDRVVSILHNFRTVCAAGTLYRDGLECTMCLDSTSAWAVRFKCYEESALKSVPLAIATRQRGGRSRQLTKPRHVVVLNEHAASVFRPLVSPGRLHVVPNPVALVEAGNPVGQSRSAAVLFAGRLTEEKGVSWLLNNWPHGHGRLLVAGEGPLRPAVEAAAAVSGGRIEYLGSLGREPLQELMRRVSGVILPSLWGEGLPMVVLESLASATPVLMSTRCHVSDEFEVGSGVVLFDPDKGQGHLSDKLSLLSIGQHKLRHEALETFKTRYSSLAWVQKMTPILEDIANA